MKITKLIFCSIFFLIFLSFNGFGQIEFVINKDGSLSDFNLISKNLKTMKKIKKKERKKELEKIGETLYTEAIRVMRLMPRWSPPLFEGKPARCLFQIPVSFSLM